MSTHRPEAGPTAGRATLLDVLGGRRSALDATVPTAVFVAALVAGGRWWPDASLPAALAAGVGAALLVAAWRVARRHTPRAAAAGLLPVLGGAVIAWRTGRPEDFFVVRILSNAVSALVWAVANWVRRPLLGVVAGTALRQHGAWRRDPDLYRAYARASWWWCASFVLRAVVLGYFWLQGAEVLLAGVQLTLSYPVFVAVVALSWWTIRRTLPADHPGLLHPRPGPPR